MSPPLQEFAIRTVHEVQTLRQELVNTRKKLQDYADTIVSLHSELRTLRDGICSACKQKFVLAHLVSSQAPEPQDPVEHANSTFSWSSLLKAVSDLIPIGSDPPTTEIHKPTTPSSQTFPFTLARALPISSTPPPPVSNTVHGNENPALISNAHSMVASSSRATPPQSVTGDHSWSVRQDTTAEVIDVAFVCAFDLKDAIQSVRFSADGKYLAAALKDGNHFNNGRILIYDVETGKQSCIIAEYSSQYSSKERPGINCLCFSPVGRYLVFGDMAGRVTVWDIRTKRIRNVFRGHSRSVEAVDFSPNGRLVASASWDSVVRIWNMRDGSARVCSDQYLSSTCVRFSLSGRYVAVPGYYKIDPELRVWSVRTGRFVEKLIGHEGRPRRSLFTLNERGLMGGDLQGPVKHWDDSLLQSGRELVSLDLDCERCLAYIGHTGTVSSIAISPNGQWVVSTSYDKTSILWNTRTAVRHYTLIGHRNAVSSVDFSPVGTYFATGGADGYVTLWRYIGT